MSFFQFQSCHLCTLSLPDSIDFAHVTELAHRAAWHCKIPSNFIYSERKVVEDLWQLLLTSVSGSTTTLINFRLQCATECCKIYLQVYMFRHNVILLQSWKAIESVLGRRTKHATRLSPERRGRGLFMDPDSMFDEKNRFLVFLHDQGRHVPEGDRRRKTQWHRHQGRPFLPLTGSRTTLTAAICRHRRPCRGAWEDVVWVRWHSILCIWLITRDHIWALVPLPRFGFST